ncbi:MFS transporter [Bosea caraganae]|nr:MFS transporter [Bosea caraganae]
MAAPRLALAGWVLFDWAAQPFFSLVQTFGYAPYFVRVMVGDPVAGQAYWGYGTAVAALLIAVLSPTLGAIVDQMGRRKLWIGATGAIYALCCVLLWFCRPGEPGAIVMALAAVCVAAVAIEIAVMVNNAMLPGLVDRSHVGRLSGLGAALGNVGGVVATLLVLTLFVANPGTGKTLLGIAPILGLDGAHQEGARAIGPFSALWFGCFILPLLLFTPDARPIRTGTPTIRAGLSALRASLRELPRHPALLRFLIANMIYTDGLVALFAMGGIFASSILGWTAIQVGLFGMLVTTAGIAGALAGGSLVDRIGARAVVLLTLGLLMAALAGTLSLGPDHVGPWAVAPPRPDRVLFDSAAERVYLAIGTLIGLCSGALLASTRIVLIGLAPPDRLTQFFGLFALSGRVTAFLGPLSVAVATQLMASQRAGIAVLMVFFAVGMALLATVKTR